MWISQPRNRVSSIILRINAKILDRNPVSQPNLCWVSLPKPNLRKIKYLYKKLTGNLEGFYSFRLTLKDRILYKIDFQERIIDRTYANNSLIPGF